MTLTIILFSLIIIDFIVTLFGVWVFNYNAIVNINLNFKKLHKDLIEKYNLIDYGIIDKNKIWLNFSIWNTLIYLLNYSWLVVSFLVFKFENQNIFVASLILIIVGNNICLLLEFIISFFIYKKYYLKNKEYINQNIEKFNLMRSNITFKNDDLFKISDQILNNLVFKIHNNYLLKIIHIKQ